MNEIPISRMVSMFSYDPGLGTLRRSRGIKLKGALVGTPDRDGYLRVKVRGQTMSVHRIAWAMHYGEQPPAMLDHVNGDPADNRIENLRPASPSQNAANKRRHVNKASSGLKGVWPTPSGKFAASVFKDGKRYNCGTFESEDAAHAAYVAQAKALFGEYANAGHH